MASQLVLACTAVALAACNLGLPNGISGENARLSFRGLPCDVAHRPAAAPPAPSVCEAMPGDFSIDDSAFIGRGDQTRRIAMVERVRRCIALHGLRNRYAIDLYRPKSVDGGETFVAEKIGVAPLPVRIVPDSVAALAALRPEHLDPAHGVFSNKAFAYADKQWTSEAVYFKFVAEAPSIAARLMPLPAFMPHQVSREDLDLRTVARAVDWSGSLGMLLATEYHGRRVQSYSRIDGKRQILNASSAQLAPGLWTLSVGEEFSGPRIWAGVVFPVLDGNGLERGKTDLHSATRQGPYQNRVESSLMPVFSGTLLPWVVPTPWPVDAMKGRDLSGKPAREVLDARRGKESICIPEQALLVAGEQEKKEEVGWAVVRKGVSWAPLQDDVRIDRSTEQMESALMVVVHESISEVELVRVLRALSAPPPPLLPTPVR